MATSDYITFTCGIILIDTNTDGTPHNGHPETGASSPIRTLCQAPNCIVCQPLKKATTLIRFPIVEMYMQ